jgi:hypothetical protein
LAHLVELKEMERLYEDYFKNESVDIKLKYNENDDSWPIELTIITQNYANNKYTFETYRKPYDFLTDKYKQQIYCKKTSEDHKNFEKVQTYSDETSWILV